MQAILNLLAHIDICRLDLQSMSFPTCTVKIPLWSPELEFVLSRFGAFQSIDKIAYAVSRIRNNGISVCISLQAAAGIPAPDVLKSVAPVIHAVDYAQIAAMTSTSRLPQGWERFSEAHLRALKSARKQMQVLCISDALAAHHFNRESIALVASFRQLKKLVLQTKSVSPDLSSLTQLTCLEDVSLMVSGHGNCAQLIHNQRHKLRYIRLSATSWAKATYHALAKVIALQTLVVNVYRLTTSSAGTIASLQRPPSIHVVLRKGSDPHPRRILQFLSSDSKVTELTLKDCTRSMLEGLNTMRHLASLKIVKSNIKDTNLQFQPGITHLTLLSCGPIDGACVSCILTAFPALKSLSFECEDLSDYCRNFGWPLMSVQSLIASTQACQLSFLGLYAVSDLSCDDISTLEYGVRAQQEVCLASPRIHVALPVYQPVSFGRQSFFIDHTQCPVFCEWRNKPTAAQQILGKVGKPVQSWARRKAPACIVAAGILAFILSA